mmetsp:Transcript_127816/g.361804  ORF Transcript_127816/g.361804 Transcript_127816/m.361804 type:complete len:303 (-) Transcript_127816:288-1196(-)
MRAVCPAFPTLHLPTLGFASVYHQCLGCCPNCRPWPLPRARGLLGGGPRAARGDLVPRDEVAAVVLPAHHQLRGTRAVLVQQRGHAAGRGARTSPLRRHPEALRRRRRPRRVAVIAVQLELGEAEAAEEAAGVLVGREVDEIVEIRSVVVRRKRFGVRAGGPHAAAALLVAVCLLVVVLGLEAAVHEPLAPLHELQGSRRVVVAAGLQGVLDLARQAARGVGPRRRHRRGARRGGGQDQRPELGGGPADQPRAQDHVQQRLDDGPEVGRQLRALQDARHQLLHGPLEGATGQALDPAEQADD